MEAGAALSSMTPSAQKLFADTRPLNGSRWLMVAVLQDVQRLISFKLPGRKTE